MWWQTLLLNGGIAAATAFITWLLARPKQVADVGLSEAQRVKTLAEADKIDVDKTLSLADGLRRIADDLLKDRDQERADKIRLEQLVNELKAEVIALKEQCARERIEMMAEFAAQQSAMQNKFNSDLQRRAKDQEVIQGALDAIEFKLDLSAKDQAATREQLMLVKSMVERMEGNGPSTPVPQSE